MKKNLYSRNKPPVILSPSIPQGCLNFKGTRTLENDVDGFQSGTSNEWTDMEETKKGSSSEYSPVEQTRFGDSFEFHNGAPLAVSTPNPSFVRDGRDKSFEAAKYWSFFKGSCEKEFSKSSCGIEKEIFSENIPTKRTKLKKRKQQHKKPECTMAVRSTNNEWMDLEDSIKGSSSEYSPVEQTRFADSFQFYNGAPVAISTPNSSFDKEMMPEAGNVWRYVDRSFEGEFSKSSCATQKKPESSLDENERRSSSDFSPVDQVCIGELDDFECFQFNEPSTAASPLYKKALLPKQKNEMYPDTAKNWRSYERNFEKESKSSCDTLKELESSSDENNRKMVPGMAKNRRSYERSFENESPKSSCVTQKEPESSSDENNRKMSETAKYWGSFKRSFEKESSKSPCGTKKEIYRTKLSKRRQKLKRRKLQYSGSFLVDEELKRSKGTSKQDSRVEPTKNILSYDICPLGMDLAPGPVRRSSSPPFFGFDVPIDDIYYLINGRNLNSKKMGTKHSRKNNSREH